MESQLCTDSHKSSLWSLRNEKAIVASGEAENSPQKQRDQYSTNCNSRYERNMGFFRVLSRRFGLNAAAVGSKDGDLVFAESTEDSRSSSTDSSAESTQRVDVLSSSTDVHFAKNLGNNISSSGETENSSVENQADEKAALPPSPSAVAAPQRSSFRRSSSIRRAFQRMSLRSLSTEPPTSLQQGFDADAEQPFKRQQKANSSIVAFSSLSLSPSPSTSSSTTTSSISSSKSRKSKAKAQPQRILRQPVSYVYVKGISGLPTQRVPRSAICCPQYVRR